MKCPNCGKEIANDSQFCEYCGAKINLVSVQESIPETNAGHHNPIKVVLIVVLHILVLAGFSYYLYDLHVALADAHSQLAGARSELASTKQQFEEVKKREAEARAREDELNKKRIIQKKIAGFPKERGRIVRLSDANFDDFFALSYDMPIIIDFFADWCPPCRNMVPIFDNIANRYRDKVIIGRYDVDEYSVKESEYDVRSIPDIYFVRNGKIVKHQVGSCSEDEFTKMVREAFEIK